MNCRESQFMDGRFPRHDGSWCGETGDETTCACGCTAYDILCAQCHPLGTEQIFGWRDIEEAVAWANGGGIAHHRNFDVDGMRIGGRVRSGPAFHTFGLEPQLFEWGRKHRFPKTWMQPAEGMFPPHFDVFGALARQLVAQATAAGIDLS